MFTALYDLLLWRIDLHPIRAPILIALGAFAIWSFLDAIYNIFFHPLSKYPGPFISKFSKIPQSWNLYHGRSYRWHYEMHKKYGPVVRYSPDFLSFTDPQAWNDIYGYKKNAPYKDPRTYMPPINNVHSLFSEARDDVHKAQRKIFTHAFSDRALKEQEPLFAKYTDMLVARIKKSIETNPDKKLDMVMLLNFLTFDIMADLAFGESLGLIETADDMSNYVGMLLRAFKKSNQIRAIITIEPFRTLWKYFPQKAIRNARREHFDFSAERVNKRLESTDERPDIWGLVLKNTEKGKGLTLDEMHSNSGLFMGAGTETTATELSGLIYFLMEYPQVTERLIKEIKDEFSCEEEISIERLPKMPYLHAVIEEALRMYPPVPAGLPRVVHHGGPPICGNFIPPGTGVYIPQWASYRLHFSHPDDFLPERFLPPTHPYATPEKFSKDNLKGFHPFSQGPRNCLGQNMAYHEMRITLVKLIWNFEFIPTEGCKSWLDRQGDYGIWDKGSLPVMVKERKH